MIRIVLVDDHTLVRKGIRQLLSTASDMAVVAEAADAAEAVRAIAESAADVVLLDVRMPGCSGVDVLKATAGLDRPPAVILLTTFDDDAVLLEGLRHGAKGYLLKDISIDRLIEAIRVVAAGGNLIRPAVTERVVSSVKESGARFESLVPPDPLTSREAEVLRMMAGGFSNREIAKAFGTSEGTVKNQVSSILSKLGVRDRVRAVLKAIAEGHV